MDLICLLYVEMQKPLLTRKEPGLTLWENTILVHSRLDLWWLLFFLSQIPFSPHAGDYVNRFRHGSLVMRMPESETNLLRTTLLYGTVGGALGVVASISEDQFQFFTTLEQQLTQVEHDAFLSLFLPPPPPSLVSFLTDEDSGCARSGWLSPRPVACLRQRTKECPCAWIH